MRSRMQCGCAVLLLGLVASPALTTAQTPDTALAPVSAPVTSDDQVTPVAPIDHEPPVVQYNLAGPRLGATFFPDGTVRSQFGWHLENQAAPGSRGPWFIVERVFLIGGVESNTFIPSGTLIFGFRLPNSVEFGVGPSVTVGPIFSTAVVVAAGQSYRVGGIRIPVNIAVALSEGGQRVSLVTGWAIRDTGTPGRYHRSRPLGGGPGE